jgi:hypothetical protein
MALSLALKASSVSHNVTDSPLPDARSKQKYASANPGIDLSVPRRCSRTTSAGTSATLSGIALHTGARVAAHAEPGEVLVSSTVKDLVAGSGIAFTDRGVRELKGIGEWRLFEVERGSV